MNTQNKLFKKLCLEDTLFEAWKVVKSKKAGGGIDGITLAVYEENIQDNIRELQDELKSGTWEPEPYLSISIPKKTKELRKLLSRFFSLGKKRTKRNFLANSVYNSIITIIFLLFCL